MTGAMALRPPARARRWKDCCCSTRSTSAACQIICGEHVTLEAGTGLVHTAPAHGLDDYFVGQKYNLPTDNPVGDDGKFVASLPLVGGLFVWKANDVVIDALQTSGHLLHLEKVQHSYPHCWRHKTPIIFRSTPQWFIGMDNVGHGGT